MTYVSCVTNVKTSYESECSFINRKYDLVHVSVQSHKVNQGVSGAGSVPLLELNDVV